MTAAYLFMDLGDPKLDDTKFVTVYSGDEAR
jgi:hypothetical protein